MKKNIWYDVPRHTDIKVGQYVVPNFISNSVAIRASDTDYIIYSPGKPLIEAWPEEWPLSNVRMHLIMPNSFHYMGVKAWRLAFPDHKLYASRAAIKRLVSKGVARHSMEITAIEEAQPPLPFNYSFLQPPGHRAHDIWIKKFDRQTHTSLWITCDSFLNYDRVSNQPLARALQRALDAAPGLKMSQVIKWFILDKRSHFKQWALKQLDTDQPTTLIPSHGEVAQHPDLAEQLASLLQERL